METVSQTMTRLMVGLGMMLAAGGAWALWQEVITTVLN